MENLVRAVLAFGVVGGLLVVAHAPSRAHYLTHPYIRRAR
jgi:hypothetical protein